MQIKIFKPRQEEKLNEFILLHNVIVEQVSVNNGHIYVPYDDNPAETELEQIRRGVAATYAKEVSDLLHITDEAKLLEVEAKTGSDQKRTQVEAALEDRKQAIAKKERRIARLKTMYEKDLPGLLAKYQIVDF